MLSTAESNPTRDATHHYRPALDGLRAVAVLGVLASHYASSVSYLYYGALGVQLFFVLSGFLITGILLRARSDAERLDVPRLSVVGRFYARRALRLLPLFYAVLLIAYILGLETIRETVLWHAFYASNLRFAIVGAWEGTFAHFWSLAVEEQFYFVWPFLILWAPWRWLPRIVVAITLCAPVFRAVAQPLGVSQMAEWTLPFGSLDALGLGALLAISSSTSAPVDTAHRVTRWIRWLMGLAAAFLAALILTRALGRPLPWPWINSLGRFACVVVFMWLVRRSAAPRGGRLERWISWAPVVYVGRISYGVYVLHAFTPHLVLPLLVALNVPVPEGPAMKFLTMTLVTIGLASISWHWYESPINALRKRIDYVARHA